MIPSIVRAFLPVASPRAKSPGRPFRIPSLLWAVVIPCVVLASVAGCGQDADSDFEASWSVTEVPILEIRDDDPSNPAPIGYVRWATRVDDGRIVVADGYGSSLHFFDAQGGFLESVGRRGEGPGEMLAPRWLSSCGGETLFMFDYNRRVMLEMEFDGSFVREFRPENRPHQFHCLDDGRFVVIDLPDEFPPPSGDGTRGRSRVWISDSNGQDVAEIGVFPSVEHRVMGRDARIAPVGDRIAVGPGDSAWVHLYTPQGERVGDLPIGAAPRAPTDDEFEQEFERWLDPAQGDPERRAFIRERYDHIPPPESIYPYRELISDAEGGLWAIASTLGAPSTRLIALDAEGARRLDVQIAGNFNLFEVGRDYILGSRVAEDHSHEVVMFGLSRNGGS